MDSEAALNVIEFAVKALKIRNETSFVITKSDLFETSDHIASQLREMFRERGLNVLVDCFEDYEDSGNSFNIYIKNRTKQKK